MPKKCTYNTRLIKATWPYTVQEIAELFGLHKNAVLRWIKQGLEPTEPRKPYLVRGDVLKAFLDVKQKTRKRVCAAHEFFCVKCRTQRGAFQGRVGVIFVRPKIIRLTAKCEGCHMALNKLQAARKLPELAKIFHLKTLPEKHISGCTDPIVNDNLERKDETT